MSTTFFVTALLDVALGLQVGLALSIAVLLFQLSSLERKGMGEVHGLYFVPLDRYPKASERKGIKCYKLTGYLWYGNASKMRDQIYALMAADAAAHREEAEADEADGADGRLTHVVLDFSGSSGLDLTTMLALQFLLAEARALGVHLVLAECSDGVRDNLRRAGLLEEAGGVLTRCCLEEAVVLIEADRKQQARKAAAGVWRRSSAVKAPDLEAGALLLAATGAGASPVAAPAASSASTKAVPFYKRLLSPLGK